MRSYAATRRNSPTTYISSPSQRRALAERGALNLLVFPTSRGAHFGAGTTSKSVGRLGIHHGHSLARRPGKAARGRDSLEELPVGRRACALDADVSSGGRGQHAVQHIRDHGKRLQRSGGDVDLRAVGSCYRSVQVRPAELRESGAS